MTTPVPQGRTVDALAEELAALDALLTDLPEEDWSRPTPCPGWDVRANVAHIVGTEWMLAGRPSPDVPVDRDARPHVRNDIGAFNEAWVIGHAGTDPGEMLALLRDVTAERVATLRAMGDDEWEAESFTPAGPDSYGRFMRIRVFDCWMHEQDIRDALRRPGHTTGLPVEVTIDEMASALGYAVGKKAGAPDGTSVTFALTDLGRDLHVAVDGRARVVEALDGPATVTLRLGVHAFSRLAGGRATLDELDDPVEVEGDTALGHQVLTRLAYTI
ncbi:MAG TPA: maleylpyruvate isomerase family mycothiol-dependent enzyme [Acidimicrobiales bacterium]|nr:maleylpyruvate isomerase family mycothiol-dependent enzyme [Acidimicrobiales bacterium]